MWFPLPYRTVVLFIILSCITPKPICIYVDIIKSIEEMLYYSFDTAAIKIRRLLSQTVVFTMLTFCLHWFIHNLNVDYTYWSRKLEPYFPNRWEVKLDVETHHSLCCHSVGFCLGAKDYKTTAEATRAGLILKDVSRGSRAKISEWCMND